MKILIVSNKANYPPDGGSIATLNFAKSYAKKGNRIFIFNMLTHKHYHKDNLLEQEYVDKINISGIKVNTRICFIRLFFNLLFSRKPYIAIRFYKKNFAKALIKLITEQQFDTIQLEGLYTLQYINKIKKYYPGKIVYRPHNVEHIIWEKNAKRTNNYLKKYYYKNLSRRLKYLEEKLLNTYHCILPISGTDSVYYQVWGNQKPMLTTPFGIDIEHFTKYHNNLVNQESIVYLGALDWIPNQEGTIWFIEKCFPLITSTLSQVKFVVGGRNAPNWLIKKFNQPNIQFVDNIDNAYDFLSQQGVVIVPLFSGSGIRVKIIESMALGKAIVSTSIGADGIQYTHNKNILIADTAEDFAQSVISLINNSQKAKELGANALELVKSNYNMNALAQQTIDFLTK